jgi:alpha-galactosidase
MFQGTLDPSLPENLERVSQDIARLRDWGFELIKHDFSTWDCTGQWGFEMQNGVFAPDRFFKNDTKTSAEVFGDLYSVIRAAAGDSLLIGCNTLGHLAAGTHEIQRTGDDTSGKEWARTLKMGVNTLAFRSIQHDTFFAADADCVGLTKDIDWRLNQMWLDVVAKSGTPLFVSADSAAIGPEQESALKDAFERASSSQELAVPEDWLETLTPHKWRQGQNRSEYTWH